MRNPTLDKNFVTFPELGRWIAFYKTKNKFLLKGNVIFSLADLSPDLILYARVSSCSFTFPTRVFCLLLENDYDTPSNNASYCLASLDSRLRCSRGGQIHFTWCTCSRVQSLAPDANAAAFPRTLGLAFPSLLFKGSPNTKQTLFTEISSLNLFCTLKIVDFVYKSWESSFNFTKYFPWKVCLHVEKYITERFHEKNCFKNC